MEIAKEFEKATTLTEVFNIMRQLRAEGYNATEVNAAANKRKKELIIGGREPKVSKINKIVPPTEKDKGVQFMSLMTTVLHPTDNITVVSENSIEI